MAVTINGSNGVSGVDGAAGTPAFQGSDANTGVWFPAADTVAISTNGSEKVRVDSSGNVGIGTTNPAQLLHLNKAGATPFYVQYQNGTSTAYQGLYGTGEFVLNNSGNYPMLFSTNNTERARIDSSGNFLIGTTAFIPNGGHVAIAGNDSYYAIGHNGSSSGALYTYYYYNGSGIGSITQNGTTGVSYNTSSDYRLKENVQPMQDALAKVALLNPVTYTWKSDGSDGQGFIAHELQEVVPDCVTGAKDAVDADGNPVYQGIDTSFLVATLTKAIQELSAKVDAMQAEIDALKGGA